MNAAWERCGPRHWVLVENGHPIAAVRGCANRRQPWIVTVSSRVAMFRAAEFSSDDPGMDAAMATAMLVLNAQGVAA